MKISLFPEKLHLIILGINNENNVCNKPYDLEQEMWVQIRVQTVLKTFLTSEIRCQLIINEITIFYMKLFFV